MSAPDAPIPTAPRSKQLRACMLCSIILMPQDFRRYGCPNCEDILQLSNIADRVSTCTTPYFDGVIAVVDPENSWVARWQRTSKHTRGMYAVRVKGRIPDEIEQELDARGIKYRPRDQTEQD